MKRTITELIEVVAEGIYVMIHDGVGMRTVSTVLLFTGLVVLIKCKLAYLPFELFAAAAVAALLARK